MLLVFNELAGTDEIQTPVSDISSTEVSAVIFCYMGDHAAQDVGPFMLAKVEERWQSNDPTADVPATLYVQQTGKS